MHSLRKVKRWATRDLTARRVQKKVREAIIVNRRQLLQSSADTTSGYIGT